MNSEALLNRFRDPSVRAVALFGSQARGDAGPNSALDFIRFVNSDDDAAPGSGSHLIDDTLVVVTNYSPATVESWFTEPTVAVQAIAGLRQAKALWDPAGYFAKLQARAQAFVWTDELQAKADRWASEQLVGWIEEAHKGLEGLQRNDVGRLLNASFGLSWGLTGVVKVQRGVLVYSDNTFLDQVIDTVGKESRWAELCRVSFGVAANDAKPPSLSERVVAGLQLYNETAALLDRAIQSPDRPLIARTVERIHSQIEL